MGILKTISWQFKKLKDKKFLYKYFVLEMICAGSLPVISLFFSKIIIDGISSSEGIDIIIKNVIFYVLYPYCFLSFQLFAIENLIIILLSLDMQK